MLDPLPYLQVIIQLVHRAVHNQDLSHDGPRLGIPMLGYQFLDQIWGINNLNQLNITNCMFWGTNNLSCYPNFVYQIWGLKTNSWYTKNILTYNLWLWDCNFWPISKITARMMVHRWFMFNDVASLIGSFISAPRLSFKARKHVDRPQKPEMNTKTATTAESERPTLHVSEKNVEITQEC